MRATSPVIVAIFSSLVVGCYTPRAVYVPPPPGPVPPAVVVAPRPYGIPTPGLYGIPTPGFYAGAYGAPPAVAVEGGPGGGDFGFAYSPNIAPFYVSFLFQLAFSAGGYAINSLDYQPGQYTRWTFPGRRGGDGSYVERARLANDADGNQWWKVKYVDGRGQLTIVEGLFSPDQSRLIRLRGRFPGQPAGDEIPVVENQGYWRPPAGRIGRESLAGATVGTEQVSVPAGTFNARHVVYGGGYGGGRIEWWLDDSVPGGVVKQSAHGRGGGREVHWMELIAFGSDASSELGSYQ